MFLRIALAITLILTLSNCTAIALGGVAAVAAGSVSDPRTIGTQIDDRTNSLSIANALSKIEGYAENTNIDIDVYNRQLLLTGQVTDANLVKQIVATAQNNSYFSKIHNQLRVTPLANASTQAKDIVIANTIRAKLLAHDDVNLTSVKVTVNSGEVFLMWLVNNSQATVAVDIARNVQNVVRVNRVFEIIN